MFDLDQIKAEAAAMTEEETLAQNNDLCDFLMKHGLSADEVANIFPSTDTSLTEGQRKVYDKTVELLRAVTEAADGDSLKAFTMWKASIATIITAAPVAFAATGIALDSEKSTIAVLLLMYQLQSQVSDDGDGVNGHVSAKDADEKGLAN